MLLAYSFLQNYDEAYVFISSRLDEDKVKSSNEERQRERVARQHFYRSRRKRFLLLEASQIYFSY